MDTSYPVKSLHAQGEFIRFIQSPGYVHITECLRGDTTCAFCGGFYRDDKKFRSHVEGYHRCPFKRYLEYDVAYANKERRFWCYICGVVKTTFAEGGRIEHIREQHGMDEEEEFDDVIGDAMKNYVVGMATDRICYVKLEKIRR